MPNAVASVRVPRLQFLTIPIHFKKLMPGLDGLRDAANWAKANRYNGLEVAMFPVANPDGTVRDFAAETLSADWVLANKAEAADGVRQISEQTGVAIKDLCFCSNIMGNPTDLAHLDKMIEAGGIIGAESIVTFLGNPFTLAPGAAGPALKDAFVENLVKIFKPRVDRATELGLKIQIENCPMLFDMGSNGKTGIANLVSSKALMRLVLATLPGILLHFDPSHIRNYRGALEENPAATRTINGFIQEFGPSFGLSGHLKDAEDNVEGMDDHGGLGDPFEANTHTQGLWFARVPGEGSIDWIPFERAMSVFAKQCTRRNVELEDLDVDYNVREQGEKYLIKAANFYRDIVFRAVYGTPE